MVSEQVAPVLGGPLPTEGDSPSRGRLPHDGARYSRPVPSPSPARPSPAAPTAAAAGAWRVRCLAAGLALCAIGLAAPPVQAAPPGSPPAPVRTVTETMYGVPVPDPYRDLEDVSDPAVAAWMKAQGRHAAATLARIPGRAALYERILRYDAAAAEEVAQVVRVPGGGYFAERRASSEDQFRLTLRQGLDGPDRVLVDPAVLEKKTGRPQSINWYAPSPDGRLLAYGLSQPGSEAAALHVMDVATGKRVGRPVGRAELGPVDWSPDGRVLLFNRLRPARPGALPTERYLRSQVMLLRVGAPLATARPVFGTAVRGLDLKPTDIPMVTLTHDGRWALGTVVNGTARELGLYLAPQASVLAGRPAWRRLWGADAQVTAVTYLQDRLYLVSHRGAPRSQVLALDLSAERLPTLAEAWPVLPHSGLVVTGVAAAADALYIEVRDGNVKRLLRRPHVGPSPVPADALSEVPLPVAGSFQLAGDEGAASAANPRLPGVLLDLQSWNRARQIYLVQADGSVTNTGLQPAGPYDAPDDVVTTEVKVPSHDGALVPMSIIHRRDVRLDGDNPTLLYAYASYGVTEEPYHSVSRMAWLDAGGVFAVANPRGSGVYGEAWYRGGFQGTKPNGWKDLIACAEHLVARGWTRPGRLGVMGGSAGAILAGRAITERPELFAVGLSVVGALDMLRMESTPNGIPNIPEFGSRKSEPGFRALLAMSTYANIRPGVAYPAMLLSHGVRDQRVEVWNSTKTAARLQAATSSGRPVLLRLDYQAGHGVGSTREQVLGERADLFAFALWQMGVPGYQPPPP